VVNIGEPMGEYDAVWHDYVRLGISAVLAHRCRMDLGLARCVDSGCDLGPVRAASSVAA
jgi:hypothetical protein